MKFQSMLTGVALVVGALFIYEKYVKDLLNKS